MWRSESKQNIESASSRTVLKRYLELGVIIEQAESSFSFQSVVYILDNRTSIDHLP